MISTRLAHRGVLMLLLLFWAISLWQLDRFPRLHNDEPTTLAPGYKLFQQGVYGSDLYTGFFGQEQIYLETMPLMPILQGLSTNLFGLGVWQMRYLPVAAGLLTVALTFALGRRLVNPQVGLLAALLLLLWPWTGRDAELYGSGIPLIDISRIARYDMLIPVFGLTAFLVWLRSGHRFLCGLLIGLATLANVYGIFWLFALSFLSSPPFGLTQSTKNFFIFLRENGWFNGFSKQAPLLLGVAACLIPWTIIILSHSEQFAGQTSKHQGRFSLFSLSFYLNNLLKEVARYQPGPGLNLPLTQIGFWLLAIGVPAALVWLGHLALKHHHRPAIQLLIPCLTFILLFALLISKKKYSYLIAISPLYTVAIAWGIETVRRRGQGWVRATLLGGLGVLLVQGVWGIGMLHRTAAQRPAPATFFAELRPYLPTGAPVTGPPHYWFAAPEGNYRDFGVAFLRARPTIPHPISFESALTQMAPRIILLNPSVENWFPLSEQFEPLHPPRSEQFRRFMTQHKRPPDRRIDRPQRRTGAGLRSG